MDATAEWPPQMAKGYMIVAFGAHDVQTDSEVTIEELEQLIGEHEEDIREQMLDAAHDAMEALLADSNGGNLDESSLPDTTRIVAVVDTGIAASLSVGDVRKHCPSVTDREVQVLFSEHKEYIQNAMYEAGMYAGYYTIDALDSGKMHQATFEDHIRREMIGAGLAAVEDRLRYERQDASGSA